MSGSDVDQLGLGKDALVVQEQQVAGIGAADAAAEHGGARLAQQRDRQHIGIVDVEDAVDRIDQQSDQGLADQRHQDAARARVGQRRRVDLQQGAKVDHRHRVAAKIDPAKA